MSNQTTSGPDVPVVPVTAKRTLSKVLATVIVGSGQLVIVAQQILPQLSILFPHQRWIGPAITAIGAITLAIQRMMDGQQAQVVNYSTPQGGK